VAPGEIQTWAGEGPAGFNGEGLPLLKSRFYWPMDVLVTSAGDKFVIDWNNGRIREVQPDGTLITVFGTGFSGDGPPDFSDLIPPGAPANTIQLNHPTDLIELRDGRILLSAWHNHKIRVWDRTTNLAFVLVGRDPGFAGDGGPAADARLHRPMSTVEAEDGTLYTLDQSNLRVRRIDPAGIITSVVGTGSGGYNGDGIPPDQAMLNLPSGTNPAPCGGITLDAAGRLYICDTLNHRIRRVDFAADVIETVVGDGTAGFGGDGGPGTAAQINNPRDLEFGPDGRLYFSDEFNNRVRAWDPVTGVIETVAGVGTSGFSGDGGAAVAAELNRPTGLEFDPEGRLYIADSFNHRVRRMRPEVN
jgi:DNA-binding beta-propeller fold protein YncE